jgi:hypothetical protein
MQLAAFLAIPEGAKADPNEDDNPHRPVERWNGEDFHFSHIKHHIRPALAMLTVMPMYSPLQIRDFAPSGYVDKKVD